MRRALVTGCSSGIGKAVTLALLSDGWQVIGLSRRHPMGLALPLGFGAGQFGWHHGDLKSGYGVEHVQWCFQDGLDALVHCAAVQGPEGPFWETDPGEWLGCVQTNLIGTARILRVALPYLKRSDDGRVLLFAGGGAFNPRPGSSAYAASKAGVVSLMETLAEELKDSTVTVNCVSPGYVPTPMTGHEDGPSPEMDRAVACVRHLLSLSARGLTGRTISAEYDDWESIGPTTVPVLMASRQGARDRHNVACLRSLVRQGVAV